MTFDVARRPINLDVKWNNVILERMVPVNEQGLVLPGSAHKEEKLQHGHVVATGPEVRAGIEAGQHVLYKKDGTVEFKLGGSFVLAFDSHIVGVVMEGGDGGT